MSTNSENDKLRKEMKSIRKMFEECGCYVYSIDRKLYKVNVSIDTVINDEIYNIKYECFSNSKSEYATYRKAMRCMQEYKEREQKRVQKQNRINSVHNI